MAGEFKIKTGLLLGSAPTQPVTSIQDTSTSITSDASSLLATGKAVYDFFSSEISPISTDISNLESSVGNLDTLTQTHTSDISNLESSVGNIQTYWSLDGSILSPIDDTVNVQLSAIQIATDAGTVSVIDMDVSSATAGTEESYSFNIDGTPIAKVYAEGDGAAGIQEPAFKVLETLYAESSVYFTGIPDISTSYVLFYNPTTDQVTYASESAISGVTQLSALTDVSIGGTIPDGSVLVYDSAASKWTYGAVDWGDIGGTLSNQTDLYNPWLVDMSINISEKYDKTGGTISGPVTISTGGLVLTTGDVSISDGDLNVNGDVAISGSLTVDGSIYSVGIEEIDVSTAFINLNTGLTGIPPSWMQSGIVVERGSEDPYAIIFDEDQDTFRIGISPKDGSLFDDASTQAVATREDNPLSGGIAFWNNSLYRFDTSTHLRYEGGNLYINNDISIGSQLFAPNLAQAGHPNIVFWNSTTGELTRGDASSLGYDTSTFLSLHDTPSIYDGSAGASVVVNDAGDGLEFANRIWREDSNEVTLANTNANVLFYENIEIEADSGVGIFVDKYVTVSSALSTEESYTFNLDGIVIAKIYGESDGAGGIQNEKFVTPVTFWAESSVYFTGIPEASTSYILYYNPVSYEITYAEASTAGGGTVSEWGDIGGTLSDQTDLWNVLITKFDTAGNGLTSSGTTVTLGTPDTLTSVTTNAVTSTSHTHAIITGISDGSIVRINSTDVAAGRYPIFTSTGLDGLTLTELRTNVGISDTSIANWNAGYNDKINSAAFNTGTGLLTLTQQDSGTVTVNLDGRYSTTNGTVTSVSAGNGMNFTTITGAGSVTLGTPQDISTNSTNLVGSTWHTHAITGFETKVNIDSSFNDIWSNQASQDASIVILRAKDVSIDASLNNLRIKDTYIDVSLNNIWEVLNDVSTSANHWSLDGSTLVPTDSTVDVQLSSISIDDDAGAVTLVNMNVTSTPGVGTEESYSFDIDGSTIMKVYGKADGGGTLSETGFVVESAQYMGDPNTNGSWRFYVNAAGDLVFEKRISGTWTEKGKFTE